MKKLSVRVFLITLLAMTLAVPVFAEQCQFSLNKEAGQMIVSVKGAKDLGAFEMELGFEPAALKIGEISKGALVEKSERTFNMLGPTSEASGKVKFGFFSFGKGGGISGDGGLAKIKFEGNAASMKIISVKVTDTKGNELPSGF